MKLRQPHCHKLQKKNDIHPFADASSLEFLSEKNDASLLVFNNHSKKRPHTLAVVRTFDYKLLDMLELHVDQSTFLPLEKFKGKKVPVGLKPMLSFSGSVFDDDAAGIRPSYAHLKSFFIDYFTQNVESKVDVAGLQYIISISSQEPTDELTNPPVHFRVYLIKTFKQKTPPASASQPSTTTSTSPRVGVEEMGPRLDFRIGRRQAPDPNLWKEAMRRPRDPNTERRKKNIETDLVGDKMGRIHLGRQDLNTLQSRKMKGLKRARGDLDAEDVDGGPGQGKGQELVVEDQEMLVDTREPKRVRSSG